MKKKKKTTTTEPSQRDQDALIYHEYQSLENGLRLPGKIEVVPTKACTTQRDLSLAYSPGVAAPSLAIAKDPQKVNDYTIRANLVAVVSNGTAVLGLGDIGPLAAKPVMEGKGVLFRKFARINVFDIELNAPKPEDVIRACQMLEPTVGGINLEDIKAPDCFIVEEALRKSLKIPVFHDDQHGTAIIVGAAFINALHLTKRKANSVKIVFSGAGAAAIACANELVALGAKAENITLCDKGGVVHKGRTDLDPYKARYARTTKHRTIKDALKGADVFVGLSVGGVITPAMVKTMAKKPIIFALANPTPEIGYDEALEACPDAIVATGRSDYPNQVNNVLGFPSIFRGALDTQASCINEEMKMAAAKALADLARESVPDSVIKIYGGKSFSFGPQYIIPKPFDPRVLLWVAPAVAAAAMKTKVAGKNLNLDEYRDSLARSMDPSKQVINVVASKAKRKLRKIVLPETHLAKTLKAAYILAEEKLAEPILVGDEASLRKRLKNLNLDRFPITIVDPEKSPLHETFAEKLWQKRQRKGLNRYEAGRLMGRPTHFGLMMVEAGEADGLVTGASRTYPEVLRPTLQIIPRKKEFNVVAGLFIMLIRDRVFLFADTTVNIDPNAEELAEIALQSAQWAEFLGLTPRVAMLSFANFGSAPHPMNSKVQQAVAILKARAPKLEVDGEMQADTAVWIDRLRDYPFSSLKEPANILIFPNLAAGNISYKLMQRLGGADVIGPILMGFDRPVHIVQQGASTEEIVRMATIAAAEANKREGSS
jgi:malate dehydrogenase (oxaloacetate-decarboxylating)(NADP+)